MKKIAFGCILTGALIGFFIGYVSFKQEIGSSIIDERFCDKEGYGIFSRFFIDVNNDGRVDLEIIKEFSPYAEKSWYIGPSLHQITMSDITQQKDRYRRRPYDDGIGLTELEKQVIGEKNFTEWLKQ